MTITVRTLRNAVDAGFRKLSGAPLKLRRAKLLRELEAAVKRGAFYHRKSCDEIRRDMTLQTLNPKTQAFHSMQAHMSPHASRGTGTPLLLSFPSSTTAYALPRLLLRPPPPPPPPLPGPLLPDPARTEVDRLCVFGGFIQHVLSNVRGLARWGSCCRALSRPPPPHPPLIHAPTPCPRQEWLNFAKEVVRPAPRAEGPAEAPAEPEAAQASRRGSKSTGKPAESVAVEPAAPTPAAGAAAEPVAAAVSGRRRAGRQEQTPAGEQPRRQEPAAAADAQASRASRKRTAEREPTEPTAEALTGKRARRQQAEPAVPELPVEAKKPVHGGRKRPPVAESEAPALDAPQRRKRARG
jgi:hypothetical protein